MLVGRRPAAIIAIVFIDLGGLAWALLMIAIGAVCMHELYRMLDRWRPAPAVGFAALAAMVIAARYGTERDVLEIGDRRPCRRCSSSSSPAGSEALPPCRWPARCSGSTGLGFAFAHATLLRQLPHGGAIIIDMLIGTFLADTAAYVGGRLFGRRPLAPRSRPNKTVEGLFCGMLIAVLAIFVAGLYQSG